MADRFDDGRDGLEDAAPTRDLWAEAQGRATQETMALSTVPEARRRHPGRWLAAAAVAALVVGVGVAIATDDDPGVTAGPEGSSVTAPSPTFGVGTTCPFTVTGEQPQLRTGHVPGQVFDGDAPDLPLDDLPTVMHGTLGEQPMEISIPGQMVTDLVGERVEDIELQRGTAQLWLSDGFAQVRWFPHTDGLCDSFTVTVFGPDDDFNRHAAEDFADRVVLPAPSDAQTGLVGTWHLVSTNVEGEPHLAEGQQFTFAPDSVRYRSGCNDINAPYTTSGIDTIHLGPRRTTLVRCDDQPTEVAVQEVMGDDPITWTLVDGTLVLHVDGAALVLAPGVADGSTTTTASVGGAAETTTTLVTETTSGGTDVEPAGWPIQGAWELYSVQGTGYTDPSFPANLEVIFGGTSIKWEDGCNEHLGTVHRVDGHTFTVQNPRVESPKPCPNNPDATTLEKVLGTGNPVSASVEGAAGSIYLTLQARNGDQVVLRRANEGELAVGRRAARLTGPSFGIAPSGTGSVATLMGSLIKKRRKRMRKKKHKKMLKRTRWQRRAAGK